MAQSWRCQKPLFPGDLIRVIKSGSGEKKNANLLLKHETLSLEKKKSCIQCGVFFQLNSFDRRFNGSNVFSFTSWDKKFNRIFFFSCEIYVRPRFPKSTQKWKMILVFIFRTKLHVVSSKNCNFVRLKQFLSALANSDGGIHERS